MRQKNKTKKQKALEKKIDMPLLSIEETINDDYMLSRWAGLFEAVNVIYEHSIDRNQDFAELDLKPLAIQKYVDIKADEILQRMSAEKEKREQLQKQ